MKLFLSLAAVCLFVAPAFGQTSITIQNPSFETLSSAMSGSWCGGQYGGAASNWVGAGAQEFTAGGCSFSSLPTNGGSVQGTAGPGSALTQDLGIAAQPNVTYVLSAYVGRRADGYNGNWIFTLLAGSTTLCTTTGNVTTIASGTWALETLTCSTGATVPSGDLTISLGCSGTSGQQSNFDLVSLTYQNSVPPLVITSPSTLPQAIAGVAYSFQETATGGVVPYTWSIAAGSLPPGLTMNSSGLISGTPTQGGPVTFTVAVTDSE